MRKIWKVVISIFLTFYAIQPVFVLAAADISKPVLESITVDKTTATPGDTVTVSVKATDDVGMKKISLYYSTPITDKLIYVAMTYNSSTNAFEGSIPIETNFEAGLYEIYGITLYDTSDNSTVFWGSTNSQQLIGGNFTVSGTSGADITKPVLQSITVDKTTATPGDTVTVSVKATDDVGMKKVSLYYSTPITEKLIYVAMHYNSSSNAYEGSIPIETNFESGLYKIYGITLYDTSDNSTTIWGSSNSAQLTGGQFRVFTESNPPTFNQLSIDKKTVESGDVIQIQVDAADDTNLQGGTIHFLSPSSTQKSVALQYNSSLQKLVGELVVDSSMEVGTWTVDSIEIKDTNENSITVRGNEIDLSAGTFTIIESIKPLDSISVTTSESWSNKVVNSDVYIAPGAILTTSNVTINGNVYVLGGFRSYGGLALRGTITANSIYFGYYTPSNGQAVFSGSNSVYRMIATNRVLSEVPLELYNTPLISQNGKINLTGATLPFVTLKINGLSYPLKSNGTFRINDYTIGSSNTIKIDLIDPSGYTYSKIYQVEEIIVDEVTKDTTSITGKTVPNSTVKILQNGNEIGTGNSTAQGYFDVQVSNLIENSTLTINVLNSENSVIASKQITVKDTTAPQAPTVPEISDQTTVISGSAEAGSTVYVASESGILGQAVADSANHFSISIDKQQAGAILSIYAVDAAGNRSEDTQITVLDKTPPANVIVNEVTDSATTVTGTAEPNSTVYVMSGSSLLGQATASTASEFSITIEQQTAKTVLTVFSEDEAGNRSEDTQVTVLDKTPPLNLGANEISDQTTTITGSSEADVTVFVSVEGEILGSSATDENNEYSIPVPKLKAGTIVQIYAIDEAGNVSGTLEVTVLDKTNPDKPVVNEFTDRDTSLTGTAEPGITVIAKLQQVEIGRATVDENGKFTIGVPNQSSGNTIEVYAVDQAGNSSWIERITVSKKLQPLIGTTRYSTAVEVSKTGWNTANTVFLVNGGAIVDGLTATPLASAHDAPMLLTRSDALPQETQDELMRLQAKNIILIGGTGVISVQVENQLKSIGFNVKRIGGSSRYATSLLIAKELDKTVDIETVFVAYGRGEPDALSIAAQAGKVKQPIILTDKTGLPTETFDWLKTEALEDAYFIGGTSVITGDVIQQVDGISNKNVSNNRISGINRNDTNAKVISKFYPEAELKTIMVAKSESEKLVDALTAGPLAAKMEGPVLLVSQTALAPSQHEVLSQKYAKHVHQIGGGINSSIVNQVLQYMD